MLSFISFILVCVGCLNWFSIGILQYDFVAGIFGSQSNVFSRLIYALVGIASLVVIVNLIRNRGRFVISFKKTDKEYDSFMEEKHENNHRKALASTESGEDNAFDHKSNYQDETDKYRHDHNCNCDKK